MVCNYHRETCSLATYSLHITVRRLESTKQNFNIFQIENNKLKAFFFFFYQISYEKEREKKGRPLIFLIKKISEKLLK